MPRTTKHLARHQFKPGQSGNPKGRPAHPIPDALKRMTVQSYRRIIRTICKGNKDEIQRIIDNPKTSALELAVATCFAKAITRGDYATVEQIVVRVLGKIPDKLIIKSSNLNRNLNGKVDSVKVKEILAEIEKEI